MSRFQLLLLQNEALKMSGMTGCLCEILAVFICFTKATSMLFTYSTSHHTLLYLKYTAQNLYLKNTNYSSQIKKNQVQ